MRSHRPAWDEDRSAASEPWGTDLLTAREERALLNDLGACRAKLARALGKLPGPPAEGPEERQTLGQYLASLHLGDGPNEARLGAISRRYAELRTQLAMANMRLVAHVAKRFRDRGIAYSDLLQEGFCGLLEAIDRFDLTRETKLATYATWWIRQAMQSAVASGAYPVKLSPRHLRQLARNQGEIDGGATEAKPTEGVSPEMIRRIHAATRPTVSLNASRSGDSNFSLLQMMSDPDGDRVGDSDRDEALAKLMSELRPREQTVLELRFGLAGRSRLSLSQVGKVLEVSKERVRQIQDRALEKLRASAVGAGLAAIAFDA